MNEFVFSTRMRNNNNEEEEQFDTTDEDEKVYNSNSKADKIEVESFRKKRI